MVPLNENTQTLPPAPSTPMPSTVTKKPMAVLARANSTGSIPSNPDAPGRCKYKTGKCSNTRSYKRNGQLHQLCMFHREKANRIQRKFDRQKRHLARSKSTLAPTTIKKAPTGPSPVNAISARFAFQHRLNNSSKSMSSLPALRDREFGDDNDVSRLSSNSESGFALDDLWATIPTLPSQHVVNAGPPSAPQHSSNERMSVDEIDFLCSAILA